MSATAAIHAGLRQLGIEQEDARDLYERVTGKRSLREMNDRERQGIVQALRQQGFKPASKGLQGRFAKKLQALWIAAHNLGLVRDRTDGALITFVRRQTGIDHVRFVHDAADAAKAIEALKAWLARDGGVDWTRTHGRAWIAPEPAKIAWAQFGVLVPGATLMGNERMFAETIAQILGQGPVDLDALTPLQWQAGMNALGQRVRKVRR